MVNRIVLNETSYFGRGSRKKLAEELLNRGYRKVLLVSDNTLKQVGVTGKVTSLLDAAGVIYQEFTNIKFYI